MASNGMEQANGMLSISAPPSPLPGQQQTIDPLDLSNLKFDEYKDESAWLNDLLYSNQLEPTSDTDPKHEKDGDREDLSLVELDRRLSRLLALLELASQDTSSSIDRDIEDISRSVPRLTFDLQLMRESALLLKYTLDGIRNRSDMALGVESSKGSSVGLGSATSLAASTSPVMERLRLLSLIKDRMEATRSVLREAESWSTLESDILALLQDTPPSFLRASERLSEAFRSMSLFADTPDYEPRRALMLQLQNALESAMGPRLVEAAEKRDVKSLKEYRTVFGNVGKEEVFEAWYFGARRAELVKKWRNANLTDCFTKEGDVSSLSLPTLTTGEAVAAATATGLASESRTAVVQSAPMPLAQFLPTFFNDLLHLLNTERTYLPSIFPTPLPILSSFVATTLDSLTPSLPSRLVSLTEYHGFNALPELIKLYKAAEDFAMGIESVMNKLGFAVGGTTSSSSSANGHASSPTAKKDRRRSGRLSISTKRLSIRGASFGAGGGTGLVEDPPKVWETALFEPFLDWQAEYQDLETRFLQGEMERERRARGMNDASALFLKGAEGLPDEAGARALWEQAITVFGSAEDALGRMMNFTHGYGAAAFVAVVNNLLEAFIEDRTTAISKARLTLTSRRSSGASKRRNGDGSGHSEAEDLEGLDYTPEDFASIQMGLRLLEVCRSISERLATFETRVRVRIAGFAQQLREARMDPYGSGGEGGYAGAGVAASMVPGTTRGALTLLRQSTLNAVDLSGLLDSLDRPLAPPSAMSSHEDPLLHHHSLSFHSVHKGQQLLFPKVRSASTQFTRSCQLLLHDTILAPLISELSHYSSMPTWTSTGDANNRGAFDLKIPTFSLSPTETISRIGDGLFNLPRLFEVYADDDALAFSIDTLPFVHAETMRAITASAGPPLPSPGLSIKARRTSLSSMASIVERDEGSHDEGERSQGSAGGGAKGGSHATAALSAETVVSTWLSSLTMSVLSYLTSEVLPSISSLSKHGAAQLASDLAYLSNVANTFDVQSEDIERWREAVDCDEKTGRKVLSGGGSPGDQELPARTEIFERTAKMRGWIR